MSRKDRRLQLAQSIKRALAVLDGRDSPNKEPTVMRSKAIGEPPLMLALSVWLAIRDAVASLGGYKHLPKLDAPATPERILMAIQDIESRR